MEALQYLEQDAKALKPKQKEFLQRLRQGQMYSPDGGVKAMVFMNPTHHCRWEEYNISSQHLNFLLDYQYVEWHTHVGKIGLLIKITNAGKKLLKASLNQ